MNRARALFNYWLLLAMAAACFLSTLVVGLMAGLITASPLPSSGSFTLHGLQPVHTTLALVWVFFGTGALVGIYTADDSRRALWISRGHMAAALLFLAGALVSAARGVFSGREYLTWPPALSIVLGGFFLLTLLAVVSAWPRILAHSAEASWLLLLGAVLLPLGLAEAHLYLLPAVSRDPGRDLAVQWHALDTVIAAWNILLYGIGLLILPRQAKPLRGSVLFLIAAIGILFDFGHHNYPSPQAHVIKIISFSATMLAVVSFVRHVRTFRRMGGVSAENMLVLRQIEGWTLFAVSTGILLAVPWINLYAHGTYAITGHTMGCVIGVNSLLVLAAGFSWSGVASSARFNVLRVNSFVLAFFCAALIGLGLAKGILRIDHDFLAWSPMLQPWYAVIVLSGLPLAGTLAWLGGDLLRCCWVRMRSLAPDTVATATAPVAVPRPAATEPAAAPMMRGS